VASAPLSLRRRVLSTVHDEAPAQARASARRHRRSLAAAIAVGVAVAVALAVGATMALDGGSSSRTPTRAAANPRHVTHASLRMVGAHAELVVSGMPEPPIGEVYELWLERPGAPPQPTDALFTVTSAGNGTVAIPTDLRGVRKVMVTSEPLGGSLAPTSAAVLRLALPHRR
jgi:Anti-sigma-K factor rskA